jgi:hypothetical protein
MNTERFRLRRGGILNVWQYDEQVFDFGGGRLLLRGTNGAGKSKTLEMLLPFVIDGDKAKMTASGRHHTSLLWLMLDGYPGQNRTGYLWVEFERTLPDGGTGTMTCGIGLRASDSARTATTWYFTSPRRVGVDLHLTDDAGPLSIQRLRAEVERDGHFFDPNQTRRYREHVGQTLFGLPLDQYEDLLRLLYWLRQPQIGEDIDPKRLAEQLVQALPQVDEAAIRSAGDTFDQLEEFGEQIDRQERAAEAIGAFLTTYSSYARGVVEERATAVVEATETERRCSREVHRLKRSLAETAASLDGARTRLATTEAEQADAGARIAQLKAGPEARAQARLVALGEHLATRRELEEQAARHRDSAEARVVSSRQRATDAGEALTTAVRIWIEQARTVRDDSGQAGVVGALAHSAHLDVGEFGWQPSEFGTVLQQSLEPIEEELRDLHERLGAARAAVKVVENACATAAERRAEASRREEESARAEATLTSRQVKHDEAVTAAIEEADDLTAALAHWQEEPAAVAVDLPWGPGHSDLTGESITTLRELVADAVATVRSALEQRRAEAKSLLGLAQAERREVAERRAEVAAETDPRPLGPHWQRSDREGREEAGAPFWRLVDFREKAVADRTRAALEAAFEGSGLLDAWVTPDGRVLAGVDDIFVVPAGRSGPDRSLGEVLRPDLHAGGLVPEATVEAVLAAIGLIDRADGQRLDPAEATNPVGADDRENGREGHDGSASEDHGVDDEPLDSGLVVGLDGSWRVGPLVGRTSKPQAQYVGASARAAERLRRLAVLDERLAELDERVALASGSMSSLSDELSALERWQRALPSPEALLRAWFLESSRASAVEDARAEMGAALRLAEAARTAAARAHKELVALGQVHDLPITADGLAARDAMLLELLSAARQLDQRRDTLLREGATWRLLADQAAAELEQLAEVVPAHERARREADTAAVELEELQAAAGASVAELERRLDELEKVRARAGTDRVEAGSIVEALVKQTATVESELGVAEREHEAAMPVVAQARHELFALERLPGILQAAFATAPAEALAAPTEYDGSPDSAAHGDVASRPWTPDDPRALLAALPSGKRADDTAVVSAHSTLTTSAAGNIEPRIAKVEEAWVAFGLGEGGELPLVGLEAQLVATVRANKELLSQRERQIFEEQVLGYLGDSLRAVRLKAEELVTAMNAQLDGVTTSQGIRVRLRWRLRDDIAADAKRAVELLRQPTGALLPSERAELRDGLHRLIDASRVEAPEESYAEHLARALDYRRWFGFSVQYHRPETGEWRDLQRKSALSQGEQKVLCYLPLFAAAAAHFASVAGAAPHAPRFVLLDDAFPKIDVRTHPLLFGLLVDLDLDFIVTSERLWGTHATVPELAIYEALRSPGERGIAQFEHRWDGHQLAAVGAGGSAGRPGTETSNGSGDG